jgi:hypothetical protein
MMLGFWQRKEEAFITPKNIKPIEVNPPIIPKMGSVRSFDRHGKQTAFR